MRKTATVGAAVSLLLCAVTPASHAKNFKGALNYLTQEQSKFQAFFGKIVSQNGVRFILRDDENNVWYHLDDQEKAGKLIGKDVLVTGTYDGVSGAIHVQNIVEAGPQDRPRPNNEEKKPNSDPPKKEASPPAGIVAENSSAPRAIPAPPLVITAQEQLSDDQISAESRALRHAPDETSTNPAPEPAPASLLSLPEEPISASSSVAVSSRCLIPLPPGVTPETPPTKNLRVGRLLRRVDPTYPLDAKQQKIEGTVRLHAVVGEDGTIRSLEPVSGPPLLVEASVVAVREWQYSPTLLDGHRIQVQEEIRLVYRLPD
jgi:TonB family protein